MKFYKFVDDHRLLFGKRWSWQGDDTLAEHQAALEWREVQDWLVEYGAKRHPTKKPLAFVGVEDSIDKFTEITPNSDGTVQQKVSYQHDVSLEIYCEDTFDAFEEKWWNGVGDFEKEVFFK